MSYILRVFEHWLHNRDMKLVNSITISEIVVESFIENLAIHAIVQRGKNLRRTYLTDEEQYEAINFLKELEVR